MNLILKYI